MEKGVKLNYVMEGVRLYGIEQHLLKNAEIYPDALRKVKPTSSSLADLHGAVEKARSCQSKAEEGPPEGRALGEPQPPASSGYCLCSHGSRKTRIPVDPGVV